MLSFSSMNHKFSKWYETNNFSFLFYCFQNGYAKYQYISAKELHFSEDCFNPIYRGKMCAKQWEFSITNLLFQIQPKENLIIYKQGTEKGDQARICPGITKRKELDWVPKTNVILWRANIFIVISCIEK